MSTVPLVEKARLRICDNDACTEGESFPVHFNPQSLQYTITSNLPNTGSGNRTKQFAGKSTGQLVMELVFDTTHNGEDVRLSTTRVARLMEPRGRKKAPPNVEFSWGVYSFVGLVKGYRETMDFFSADGVPLRATVNLTLTSQDRLFERRVPAERQRPVGADEEAEAEAAEVAPPSRGNGRGVSALASEAGSPEMGRQIGEDNELENLRFPPQDRPLRVGGSQRPARAAGLTARSGTPVGESQTPAVFSGLRGSQAPRGGQLDVERLRADPGTAGLDAQTPDAFDAAGQATQGDSGQLKTSVGRPGELLSRIQFREGG